MKKRFFSKKNDAKTKFNNETERKNSRCFCLLWKIGSNLTSHKRLKIGQNCIARKPKVKSNQMKTDTNKTKKNILILNCSGKASPNEQTNRETVVLLS